MSIGGYWEARFQAEGMIWGREPSPTVEHARKVFVENRVKTVLVPGAGYGRNTKELSDCFEVDGLELSPEAIRLGEEWDPRSYFIEGSALGNVTSKQYDAIYCYDLLHLFLEQERKQLIGACLEQLKPNGIMYFTCFSDTDSHSGQGRLVEAGTYEYMEGKYAHFFTEEDLLRHFEGLQVLETGMVTEQLGYDGGKRKEYVLRYIIVRLI